MRGWRMLPIKKGGIVAALVCCLWMGGCASQQKAAATPAGTVQVAAVQQPQPKVPLMMRAMSGFGLFSKIFPKKKTPPKAEAARSVGTIKLVNEEAGFVLIETTAFQDASSGGTLVSIMNQRESATLKVSEMRNPPFLIADIVSGKPAKGDRVYKP